MCKSNWFAVGRTVVDLSAFVIYSLTEVAGGRIIEGWPGPDAKPLIILHFTSKARAEESFADLKMALK